MDRLVKRGKRLLGECESGLRLVEADEADPEDHGDAGETPNRSIALSPQADTSSVRKA
jgi:hypothetical protein